MAKKYEKLGEFLDRQSDPSVRLSFDQIEKILEAKLPKSAHDYDVWWSNSLVEGRHNEEWLKRGWQTTEVNRKAGTIRFIRTGAKKATAPRLAPVSPKIETPVDTGSLANAPVLPFNDVILDCEWKFLGKVSIDGTGSLVFPAGGSGPGVYRIRIQGDGKNKIYVGESQDLSRRFRNYRMGPEGQRTSRRIHLLLKDVLDRGEGVEVDVVAGNSMLVVNGSMMPADFNSKAVRCLYENAAIVALGQSDIEIVNLQT